jgi:hypothetical protein
VGGGWRGFLQVFAKLTDNCNAEREFGKVLLLCLKRGWVIAQPVFKLLNNGMP